MKNIFLGLLLVLAGVNASANVQRVVGIWSYCDAPISGNCFQDTRVGGVGEFLLEAINTKFTETGAMLVLYKGKYNLRSSQGQTCNDQKLNRYFAKACNVISFKDGVYTSTSLGFDAGENQAIFANGELDSVNFLSIGHGHFATFVTKSSR